MSLSAGRGFEMVADGVHVVLNPGLAVASLRHFDGGAGFRGPLVAALGSAMATMPQPLQALAANRAESPVVILAWRGVTETLMVCRDSASIAALEAAVAGRSDLAVVDQTGGVWVWKVSGERARDLLARLGGGAACPIPGQSLTSRLGELTVLAACVTPGEIFLLADRVHAEHLSGWVKETLADF